jgi:hypothetical protein
MNANLTILTVATKSDGYYEDLVSCAEKYHIPLVTLGFGGKWNGYLDKINLVNNYLTSKTNQQTSNDIFLIVDGYDVLLVNDPKILQDYYVNHCFGKILISCERKGHLFGNTFHKIFYGSVGGILINVGAFCGTRKSLTEMYKHILSNYETNNNDDQLLITKYANEFPNRFTFDVDNVLFETLNRYDSSDFALNGITVHGTGNRNLDAIRDKILPNKKMTKKVGNRSFITYSMKGLWHYGGTFLQYYGWYITILVITIITIHSRSKKSFYR